MTRNRFESGSYFSARMPTPDGIEWPTQSPFPFNTPPGWSPNHLNNPLSHPSLYNRAVQPSVMHMNPRGTYQYAEHQHDYTDEEKSTIAHLVSEYEKCKSWYFAEDSISKRNEILLTMATHMDKIRTALKVPDLDCVSSIYGLANNALSMNVRLPMEKVVKEKVNKVKDFKQNEAGEIILEACAKLFYKKDIATFIPFLVEYVGHSHQLLQNASYLDFNGVLEEAKKKYFKSIGMHESSTCFTDLVELFYTTEKLSQLLLGQDEEHVGCEVYRRVCSLVGTAYHTAIIGSREHAIRVHQMAIDKIAQLKLRICVPLPKLNDEKHQYNLKLVCLHKAFSNAAYEKAERLYKDYVELCFEVKHGIPSELPLEFEKFKQSAQSQVKFILGAAAFQISSLPKIR